VPEASDYGVAFSTSILPPGSALELAEKLAPAFLAGVPSVIKPASPTAFLTAELMRLIVESELLPPGAVQFVAGSLGDTLVWTLAPVYFVTVVGLSPLQLVLVGTFMELTIFVCEVPTGIVADVVSRKLSIVIGYLVMGAAIVFCAAKARSTKSHDAALRAATKINDDAP